MFFYVFLAVLGSTAGCLILYYISRRAGSRDCATEAARGACDDGDAAVKIEASGAAGRGAPCDGG